MNDSMRLCPFCGHSITNHKESINTALEEACRQWCDFIDEAPERRDGKGFAKFFYDIANEMEIKRRAEIDDFFDSLGPTYSEVMKFGKKIREDEWKKHIAQLWLYEGKRYAMVWDKKTGQNIRFIDCDNTIKGVKEGAGDDNISKT